MKAIQILGLVVLALGLARCGKDEFKYDYNVNGCKTGEHAYSSKEEYCAALQNQKSNNGCAVEMRSQAFKDSGCGSEFKLVEN